MEPIIVYGEGPAYASVCSSQPVQEVVDYMAARSTGGNSPWRFSEAPAFHTGEPNPCPCDKEPETRTHYLFECASILRGLDYLEAIVSKEGAA